MGRFLWLGGSLALPRLAGSPLDDSVRGVFRGQNISLHRVLHSALSQILWVMTRAKAHAPVFVHGVRNARAAFVVKRDFSCPVGYEGMVCARAEASSLPMKPSGPPERLFRFALPAFAIQA